jgi:hypothetical protein
MMFYAVKEMEKEQFVPLGAEFIPVVDNINVLKR